MLGAAAITRSALLRPADGIEGVDVAAVAARDPDRARVYAARQGIERVHEDYDSLLADPEIDAVYVPTPASHHARWTVAAIEAGKHVLVEKPFAANAEEASLVAELATRSEVVVMEAYHTAHHPSQQRLAAILATGTLGRLVEVSARFSVPPAGRRNIRRDPRLAGGVLLDVGYYPVRLLRDLLGEPEVVSASSAPDGGSVDLQIAADLLFQGDIPGRVEASMRWREPLSATLALVGEDGRLSMRMPFHPHQSSLRIRSGAESSSERPDRRTTYSYQLEHFRDAVLGGGPVLTDARSALAQLTVIDAIYRAAGLEPRRGVTF